ncbi:MAG: hypothetical protein ACRDHL_03485 [Candidatus Promineifilaceae bacterium]
MYPEDRVLVAYVPAPADFELIRKEGWYRIPQRYAPKGLHAEYFAFYFGRRFGPQKWSVHFYARQLGNELLRRVDLLPEEPDHPRANQLYYKVALGPLQELVEPIVSLRLRRITFLHTTWDRFQSAKEINDLFLEGGEYVDRLYATLKERGLRPERHYEVKEGRSVYQVPLSVPCRRGRVDISLEQLPQSDAELVNMAAEIERLVEDRGGALIS